MGKIKLLKNNKKSLFMIISLMVFSFIIIAYSLLMMFSPIVNQTNMDFVNGTAVKTGYTPFMKFFLKNGSNIMVGSAGLIIYWIPLVVAGTTFILMLTRMTIHLVGYRSKTKKGIARIVRPIRSYQFTMIFAWILFVVLTLVSILSFLSALPFLMGISLKFSATNFISLDQTITATIANKFATQFGQIYWLSFGLFAKTPGGAAAAQNAKDIASLIGWFILPIIIPFSALITAFVGVVCGECSWWNINLIVLRDIDLQTGAHLVDTYAKVEKPKIKEKKNKKVKEVVIKSVNDEVKQPKAEKQVFEYDQKLARKCSLFYKNLTKMLEDSKNTDSKLYRDTISRVEELTKASEIDWNKIGMEIEAQMNLLTSTDRQFVELIEQLMLNPRLNLFGRYKNDLEELIEGYRFSLKTWDLFAAEIKLEQIFAITFRSEELLPKVGYCLKNRVSSSWKNIDARRNVINRLEVAKNDKDYKAYREICAEVIKEMSPIKPIITSYVDKIIYN
ncbi:hypothetical protein [Spiroplasma endosymbiont of Diplazon laetatorius]|uniref:hypothetical protein n=1 Tax=Spiroplasma endosymbiont of Diplazon laetatorius TaxID=3066322 RepID=UPI0030D4C1A2